jgi:signal transduction histidine kinase
MKTRHSTSIQKLPLQFLLIVPFVVQIFAAVSLVGYLSFKNGQKAVNTLADQLIERTSGTVNQHLDSYLSIPIKIIQMDADAIQMGLLNVRDRKTIGKYFWHQMQAYDLTYLGIGLTTGEGGGAGRYDGKTVVIDDWDGKPRHKAISYATDNQGNRTVQAATFDWDNFKEAWYTEPLKAGKPVWSRIFTINYPNYPYIAASVGRPIYDVKNRLLGMIAADIHLLKLGDFLNSIDVSNSGKIFILERNGMLIANSGKQQPFTIANGEIKRLKAIDSPDPVIRGITQQLQQSFNNFQSISAPKKLRFDLQGTPNYVRVTPWRDQYGVDWLVVVSVPEPVFMAQINANTTTTIYLCLGALGIACVIGLFTSGWITDPILKLSQASEAMASGNLDQTVKPSGILELSTLANSFNYMIGQLRESFVALEKSNEELEDRVEQRTVELKNTLTQLQRTQAQVIQSEKMSSLGQLVAGVAHEINNPVNFIHGNLSHVQEYTKDLLDIIDIYQQYYPNPAPEIKIISEEIELDFLQSDLPKMLNSMKIGTDRIRQIVLSLRNFSRMDEADIKQVDIHEGIDSTLMILQHRLKARPDRPGIEVIKEYNKLPLVECYAGQLNQVFMNIITNAIDAIEESNSKQTNQEISAKPNQITIQTSVVNDQWVRIAIADNGPGIPQEIQQRIFDPFFTTKAVGKGTGMGMSISYQIITEKHNGKLECFSNCGEGTQFLIEIPIR